MTVASFRATRSPRSVHRPAGRNPNCTYNVAYNFQASNESAWKLYPAIVSPDPTTPGCTTRVTEATNFALRAQPIDQL